MKKYFVIALVLVAALVFGAYFSLFSKQVQYQKTLGATTSSVLVLDNFDRSKVRVVTGNTDKITVDLKGSEEDLSGLTHEEDGIFKRFGISSEFSSLAGTITVPAGTLIDVNLSENADLKVSDLKGNQDLQSPDSFLVDSTTLNSFEFSGGGSILLNSWGDLTVWDDQTWDPVDDTPSDSGSSDEPVYCGIGSQAIRDYCCVEQNVSTPEPACDGLGHFVFDNTLRDCAFRCDPPEEGGEGEGEEVSEPVDCGIGGQSERNACCAGQHTGEYQGCLGSWLYNNSSAECQFQCDEYDPEQSPPPGGSTEETGFDDPVSIYCNTIQDPDDRDLCCDDTLKNPLSSGPRPGFPDCIGKWHFDDETGCQFECADYIDMIQIINQIKQNSQQEQ